MKFQLCHNDKVIAEIQNDLVRFDDDGGNVDQIGFDLDTAHEVNCVKCDIGIAKIIQPFAVKGELWFPPFSLKFNRITKCKHQRLKKDNAMGRCECRDCGKFLRLTDAIDILFKTIQEKINETFDPDLPS